MKPIKIISVILIIGGFIALLISLLADVIGFGGIGFGYRQIIGTIAGGIATVAGILLLILKK